MRTVPTGRKGVAFTKALPRPDVDDESRERSLDEVIGLVLAGDKDTQDDPLAPADPLDGLTPIGAAVAYLLHGQITDEMRARLTSERTCFVLVRYPGGGSGWRQTVFDAASRVVQEICGEGYRRCVVDIPRLSKTKQGPPDLDAVTVTLLNHRVAVALADTVEGEDPYVPYADAVITLTALTEEAVASVLTRVHGALTETDHAALAELDIAALTPAAFDLAVLRSAAPAEAIARLRASLSAAAVPPGPCRDPVVHPMLETLPGYGAVMPWARALASDIRAYADGRLSWSEVDKGALLAGPPGTGKTLLANALAGSAGCRSVMTSAATWIAEDGGSLGAVVKAIRTAFEVAASELPTILFVDEIDSIPARGSSGRWNDYWAPINNCLLEMLDGSTRREGLVVLAACNHPDKIDPALLRSGRLDRIVTIDRPSAADLSAILAYHLPDVLGDDDAERVASVLEGTATGADIQRIAREARRLARTQGRSVTATDLLTVALPPDARGEDYRWRIAVHESGHAVAHMLAGRVPVTVSIVGFGPYGGAVRTEVLADEAVLDEDMGRRWLVPLLAARAAEEVILGSVSAGAGGDASSDLARATALVTARTSLLGLGASLLWQAPLDPAEVDRALKRFYGEALMLVLRHRSAIEALARRLMHERVLTRTALRAFARGHGIADEGRSRGAGHL